MPEPVWVLARLMLAVVFGGVVGWQREARDRPAGLRTHVLVCVGAAVYTLASASFGERSDPARVAAQVATGMGFLGAGTIIRHGNIVRGLTTAASLWAVAAIGICVGIGGPALWVGGMATIIVLLTLTVLRGLETHLLSRARLMRLTVRLAGEAGRMEEVRTIVAEQGVKVEAVEMAGGAEGGMREMRLRLELPSGTDIVAMTGAISRLDGFISVRCE